MPTSRLPRATGTPSPSHLVQFYEDERFLAAAVADFIATGLAEGTPAAMIGRSGPRHAVLARLRTMGHDVNGAIADGRLLALDSRRMLATFMDGERPDARRFTESIGGLLDRVAGGAGGKPIRVYGDMVDLLWRAGNASAAVQLERLWNDLASGRDFSLLCAYGMAGFADAAHRDAFDEICGEHAHVLPTERFVRADETHRMTEVGRLQQRARALETEIMHRARVERELREALRARELAEAERERMLIAAEAARVEAERANRAKSDFLARMSHELRTPLNAIAGHVQLVELGVHGPLTEPQREALARAQRSQRNLLALIDDLLDLSRVEAGHVAYAVEPVALPPLLDELTAMLDPLRAARKLEWSVRDGSVGLATARVRADREKTQRILLNVLGNAIKYTPASGRIVVDFGVMDGRPDMMRVRVRDTGPGIPAGKLESVFEPFVQLGNAPSGTAEGVGLGLAISRSLARGMGGDLTAESAEGEGATFILTLPGVD